MKSLASAMGVSPEYLDLTFTCLSTGLRGNSYFLSARTGLIYRRDTDNATWHRLETICGQPRFGDRSITEGYALLDPEYIGARWVQETDRNRLVSLVPLDAVLAEDVHREWQWSSSDNGLTETVFPNGFRLAMKEIPTTGFDANLSPAGFIAVVFDASGREVLRQKLPPKNPADKWVPHLVTSCRRVIAYLQMVIADADSGMDFGNDRRWESVSPESLASNLVYASKHMSPAPINGEELRRLQELNRDLIATGRFNQDRGKNLSLDRLFAELIVRYLAFGVQEGVTPAEGIDHDFSEVRECILDAGRRMCARPGTPVAPDKEPT